MGRSARPGADTSSKGREPGCSSPKEREQARDERIRAAEEDIEKRVCAISDEGRTLVRRLEEEVIAGD